MKARKKFFTMFLSMLLVFTMMPLSAIPVTAASSTDPPPAAIDQTKPVDETLTETDIQTETVRPHRSLRLRRRHRTVPKTCRTRRLRWGRRLRLSLKHRREREGRRIIPTAMWC